MKVTIDDLWLKNDDDGNPPSRAAKRSLANSRDPMKANVPEKWRKSRYGVGMRWRCHWTIVKDGRRVQRVKQFARLAEAQEYAAAMEDDIRRGRYRDPRQELRVLDDVAGEWLASKVDLKPGTAGRYARELRLYILPKWGGMTLRELRPDILLYLVVFRFGLPECLEIRKRWYFNAFAILQVVTGYDCMERNVTVFVCGLYAE